MSSFGRFWASAPEGVTWLTSVFLGRGPCTFCKFRGGEYTHSRLSSLVEGATVSIKNSDVTSIDTTSLQESISLELVIT